MTLTLVRDNDVHWADRAACTDLDGDLFFPPDGATVGDDVKALCASCPVREDCLAAALLEEQHEAGVYGYRGGKTAADRKTIRDRRRCR